MTHYYNMKKNNNLLAKLELSQVDSNTVGDSGSSSGHHTKLNKEAINMIGDGLEDFNQAAGDAIKE